MEVAINNLWKSHCKHGNAELGWIILFNAQIKQYVWNRDWYQICLLFSKNVKVRSVSTPSHILEFFDRNLCKKVNNSITSNVLHLLRSFRKNHNSQHSVLKIMKIWKKHFYKRKQIVVILWWTFQKSWHHKSKFIND